MLEVTQSKSTSSTSLVLGVVTIVSRSHSRPRKQANTLSITSMSLLRRLAQLPRSNLQAKCVRQSAQSSASKTQHLLKYLSLPASSHVPMSTSRSHQRLLLYHLDQREALKFIIAHQLPVKTKPAILCSKTLSLELSNIICYLRGSNQALSVLWHLNVLLVEILSKSLNSLIT